MEEKELILNSGAADGARLTVVFTEDQGRFRHDVSLQKGEDRVELLASREGPNDAMWPSSPPLQQVTPHRLADGRDALLAVGMAGSSHWSLSVTAGRGRLPELIFEAACRPATRPEQLGSQYGITSARVLKWDEHAVSFITAGQQIGLAVEPAGSVRIAAPDPLVILCDPPASDPPETSCWTYRVTVIR